MSETDRTLTDRLSSFFDHIERSISRVEIECGFSRGSLSYSIREGRAIVSDRLRVIVEKYPQLNADWLLTGRGRMLIAFPDGKLQDFQKNTINTLSKVILHQIDQLREYEARRVGIYSGGDITI